MTKIREALETGDSKRKRRNFKWWDEECKIKKEGLRKVLKRWRKDIVSGEEYKRCRLKYKKLCKRKREEEWESLKKQVEETRTGKERCGK